MRTTTNSSKKSKVVKLISYLSLRATGVPCGPSASYLKFLKSSFISLVFLCFHPTPWIIRLPSKEEYTTEYAKFGLKRIYPRAQLAIWPIIKCWVSGWEVYKSKDVKTPPFAIEASSGSISAVNRSEHTEDFEKYPLRKEKPYDSWIKLYKDDIRKKLL